MYCNYWSCSESLITEYIEKIIVKIKVCYINTSKEENISALKFVNIKYFCVSSSHIEILYKLFSSKEN